METVDFSSALAALKGGSRIRRIGWNGSGMWVALSGENGPRVVATGNLWSKHAQKHAIDNGGNALVHPCLIMKTATGEIVMGWLASQTDLLANDWIVLPDEHP